MHVYEMRVPHVKRVIDMIGSRLHHEKAGSIVCLAQKR